LQAPWWARSAADIPVVVKEVEQRFVDAALEKARAVTRGQLGSLVKRGKRPRSRPTPVWSR
jgi:hypothetical protein